MARVLQLRRGTTAENNLFTGALAEATYDTSRKELRVHDGSTVGGKVVSAPTGMITPFGGSTAPEGWLVCDGSAISRTDYADLFAVIGTTYGDGDGSSTFNLPEKNIFGILPDYDHPTSVGTFNSSNPYTAPSDGFFYCAKANGIILYVNGAESYYGGTAGGGTSAWGATVFVSKGDIITTDVASTSRPTFYPLKTDKNYCIKY